MAKREFRKDGKIKKLATGDYIGTLPNVDNPFGVKPMPAPDPTSVNAGFGSPGSLPGVGGGRPIGQTTPGKMPPQQQSQLQALFRKYGPYASIGAMAGGIGGKAGIAAAPAIALLMQELLKGKGDKKSSIVAASADGMASGGPVKAKEKVPTTKEIKSMKREFRSNGPKVRNLQVSPRKAMGMGILSPTAIPQLKKGGEVKRCMKCGGMAHGGACMKTGGKMVMDTDNDGMKHGGGVKKYAKGGEIRGWGMARGKGPSHVE
jgi:hypothetical protein